MQTLRKKTSPCKYRNDPGRFFGDGVQFKAKLIGILEVGEARGDRMCQEALQDLKMAIRAAGEHKQRITIHVTIDGLRLRDEKTSDSLYHHPVHKISFIAQDMTDSRAFGYIFGSPDSGHRFFGIKTDKAASQVVLAMRDLFQVVFELKKKEIELARQQIQNKTIHEHQPLTLLSVKNTSASDASSILSGSSSNKINNLDGAKSSHVKEMSPESVADLVDLEQELSSIQRGITQMERITPSEPTPTGKNLTDEDPFGDSFTNFPTYNLLPPPESSRSRHSKPNKPPDSIISSSATTTSGIPSISNILSSQSSSKQNQINASSLSSANDSWLNDLDQNDVFDTTKAASIVAGSTTTPIPIPSTTSIMSSPKATASSVANSQQTPPPSSSIASSSGFGMGLSNSSPPGTQSSITANATAVAAAAAASSSTAASQNDESQKSGEDYISTSTNPNKYSTPPNALLTSTNDNLMSISNSTTTSITNNSVLLSNSVATASATHSSQYIDAFSDLDPLGTGRIRPYVDKKYFFQELKNPPKKVLKDLSSTGPDTGFTAQFVSSSDGSSDVLMDDPPTATGTEDTGDLYQTNQGDRQTSSLNTHTSSTTKALNLNFNHNFIKADGHQTDLVMLPRDTDPFSPTRKKSDPFQDGDIFGKLDPFEFEFPTSNGSGTGLLPETKITNIEDQRNAKKDNMFNGPLQVNLPPESSGWAAANSNQLQQQQQQHRRVERQTSESPTAGSRNRPSSVFKQNTVDVISSISSKKMPHLFGQKFSKRDSNSINMRRLQESDSLSENETAPEPPPRPDSVSHSEPPPLPPKKQFSDIVIRPRITPPPSSRYESVSAAKGRSSNTVQDASVPPIPLPSRRIGRSEGTYPGPGRPRKPGNDEDDYLQPLPAGNVPPLLPPPQTRGRTRRQEIYENKTEAIAEHVAPSAAIKQDDDEIEEASFLPDITLSQLLTLGIDELAAKLSVPTSKLSTMTLVELTTYLSEFIEKSKKPKQRPVMQSAAPPPEDSPPIFKVNFDQMPDATFVAKFDDNFGEEEPAPFVANFSQFDIAASSSSPAKTDETLKAAAVPSADRYAVFREIIDQELQQDSMDQKSSPEADDEAESLNGNIPETNTLAQFSDDDKSPTTVPPVPKIDTKITEAISHAKDRYAALRDIILVEDLFEKPPPPQSEDLMQDFPEFSDGFNSNTEDLAAEEDQKSPIESSPESNQNEEEDDQASSKKGSNKFLHILTVSSTTKDDLEIDELMNRAISNLSLDSREHLSPSNAVTKSPATIDSNGGSPHAMRRSFLGTSSTTSGIGKSSQFNDMSTSPIPLQKSPAPVRKSPLSKSPLSKSPIPPQLIAVSNLIDASKRLNSGSLSDVICGSSPDADTGLSDATAATKPITGGKSPKSPKESWAVFDKGAGMDGGKHRLKSPKPTSAQGESPCSSDGKEDWHRTGGEESNKRWPKGQTSSSSRDLSPWDDETSDYKKRIPPTAVGGADRHGYYMRHARRMNSCDEDYEYEEEMNKRRERKIKSGISRSRENFEFDSPQWYHTGPHHTWSPQEEEGRARSFDRGSYERTTYGPPAYDKREHKIPPSHLTYDRRDYKGYDKRKYYREYMRPNYDFEPYGESPDTKDRKMPLYYGDGNFEKSKPPRRDYENIYEENFGGGPRSYKSRDYIYERDRKSFDRDSVESYESAGRRRKSFGSGDVYGSLESREEFRERYMGGPEKTRSLRKGMKMRLPAGSGMVPGDDYDQDSETEVQSRRVGQIDSRSLQRPTQGPQRMRKSSGSSPWDGEEPPPPGHGQKGWKRPSSASESERRLAESRRAMGNTPSGSDGEKDRRFRKKPRSRTGKEIPPSETRQSQRYGSTHRDNYDYINYDDYDQPTDEDKFERLNRRRHEMHQRMMESERRQKTSTSDKYAYDDEDETPRYMSKKESNYYSDKPVVGLQHKNEVFDEPVAIPKPMKQHPRGADFDFNDFEDTPRSNTSSKFNFEEHGFESDFNSPPPASCNSASTTTPATKSSFRFSNDFSDKEKHIAGGGSQQSVTTFDSEFSPAPAVAPNNISNSNITSTTTTTTTQKLRFDDRVTISKFDNDQPSIGGSSSIVGCCDDAFEDDFSKAEFDFEKEDQWNPEPPKKNNLRLNSKLQQRQEMIKKSESINIFAKKNEDPFEDDEFFKSPPSAGTNGNSVGIAGPTGGGGQSKTTNGNGNSGGGNGTGKDSSNFQWESNFAKFDENM
ncbi:protein disabled isoform X2 [Episyrphus balteatus]|uniref:protein disabled isoform X2 n=1 Tax=Episyrphus balteatus TaxID=286459 RepID=UPI0024862B33|nr:protein disabled isoform X2 [Episyrphus balteatus]